MRLQIEYIYCVSQVASDSGISDDMEEEDDTTEEEVHCDDSVSLELRPSARKLPNWMHSKKKDVNISLGWDNFQMKTESGRDTSKHGNKMLMMGVPFVTLQPLPSLHLDDTLRQPARSLSADTFLPSQEDLKHIFFRASHVVRKIIVKHLTCFMDIKVEQHVQHEFSEEMTKKTTVINLGPIHADPTAGTIEIMKKLQEHCPKKPDGQNLELVTNGDQMSCERYSTFCALTYMYRNHNAM